MYNCIIINSDPCAIDILQKYIELTVGLKLIHSYTDPLNALHEISIEPGVNIIFTDIKMPLISGIELSKMISHKAENLVFTADHSKYAFDAFEVGADAYLLKPYTFAKFSSTINRLLLKKRMSLPEIVQKDEYFFVKNKTDKLKIVKIKYDHIIAIESLQNYIRIYTIKDKITTYFNLTELKLVLNDRPEFIQIHRSFIISKNYIDEIDCSTVVLHNNLRITMGDSYKENLLNFVKHKTLRTNRKLKNIS